MNVEYRLAPEAPYPGGAEDIGAACAWASQNAREFGGDPGRIFLIGHSAGGTHVAGCVLDPALPKRAEPAGMVLISGRLRADVRPENPNAPGVRAYFGDDPALHESRSPVTHAHLCRIPVLIAVAEFENPLLDVYAAEMLWRLGATRGRVPHFVRLRGHNHISIVAHFNTGEDILGREILAFISETA
jgi:acetyl esterase